MKKILLIACVALAATAQTAAAIGIGVAVFGGQSYPVVQDDRGFGGLVGIRVPVNLVPLIAVEPYYSKADYGDKTITTLAGPQTIEGGYVSSWGLNVLVTSGTPMLRFYPYFGISSNTDDHPPTGETTTTGYNLGVGVGVGLPIKLSVDLRGEGQMIVDGDTSRKFGNWTLGVSYSFLSLP